jgi:hypothetical protein
MRAYNREENPYGKYSLPIPKGLVVHRVSRRVATYTLPDEKSLRVRGAVFWDGMGDGPFQEIKLTLSRRDDVLGDFLLSDFRKRVVERFPHK